MLFSLLGEIGLIVIGTLYVIDCYFDSFINLIEVMTKNKDDEDPPLTEAAKRMYS